MEMRHRAVDIYIPHAFKGKYWKFELLTNTDCWSAEKPKFAIHLEFFQK